MECDLAELPKSWTWATYEQIGKWSGGGTPSKQIDSYWTGGDIPWISPKDVKTLRVYDSEDKITDVAIKNSPSKLIPSGSLLFVVRSGILRRTLPVALIKIDAAVNQDLKALTTSEYIFDEYLLYHALAYNEEIRRSCAKDGTTVESIEFSALKKYRIPLAPLPEQHRIVARIEELFSRLDAGVAALQRAKIQLRRYRQAVLKAAVEGRLTQEWRSAHPEVEPAKELLERILKEKRTKWEEMELKKILKNGSLPKNDRWKQKYKAPDLLFPKGSPELPNGWCYTLLEPFLSIERTGMKTGPFGSLLKKDEHRQEGIPVLGIENIESMTFVHGSKIHISKEKARQLAGYDAKQDDILISRSGTVGEVCVVPDGLGEAIISTNLMRVTLFSNGLIPKFFCLLLNGSPFVLDQVSKLCKGSTRSFLNQEILLSIVFPLSSLAEQKIIINEFERYQSQIDRFQDEFKGNLARISRLRQSILKRAFEGRLVPQDPGDEPACVLLERIEAERAKAPPKIGRKNSSNSARQMRLAQ